MSAHRPLSVLACLCALFSLPASATASSEQEAASVLIGHWSCKGTQKDGRNSARLNFDVEYRADGSSEGKIDLTLRFPGGKVQAAFAYSSKWSLDGESFQDRPQEVMSVSYSTSGKKSGNGPSELDLLDTLSKGDQVPYRLEVVSVNKVDFHVPGRAKPIKCRRN